MEGCSSFFHYQIMAILSTAIYFANAGGWSKFVLMESANTIDQSIVVETYARTNSSRMCGMKCVQHATESFYYVGDSATCFCNNQPDDSITTGDPADAMFLLSTDELYMFVRDSVTCVCNNQPDDSITTENQTGPMVYGYLVKHGSESECQAFYDMGVRTDGEFTTSAGKHILCNFTSLGWTVFQRRVDGNVDFQRNWTEYVAGFGNPDGEFWLGLESVHQMTTTGCELHVYLEAGPDTPNLAKGFARYATFSVESAMTNYSLNLAGFSGTVGDSLAYHIGMQFSTYDADNDLVPVNCALERSGGWWFRGGYYGCHKANLNSVYLGGSHNRWDGIRWENPWGAYYSLFRTEMAVKC